MIPVIDGVLSLFTMAGGLFSNWQKRKMIKSQGKVDVEKAKVEGNIALAKSGQQQEGEYNTEAQKGMAASWKDEVFVVVWLSILVGAFIPGVQPYIKDGFIFLNAHTPDWYSWCLIGMVVASFGLKGWKMWGAK